ncbi:histidine phosphatase family protein [uncultured Roseobacter sp.]|uniref:histidine phosphatase family protein n=1 Tax=uncultured Roseobacter sp. TaxID=114847 RepID=UPI002601D965|nr:histidine phosphatase family protein [uncultured Roseobacter sp.]
MTVWHWVRHGPTHAKTLLGWKDLPADLSDTAQIARLRAHLPDRSLLIASDLIRASATADAVQGPDHDRLPDTEQLREFDFGDWDGRHFSDVAATDPELSRAYWEQPGDTAPPGGESWNAAAARINAQVDRINADYPTAEVIAVAHIGVILTQVQRARAITAYDALAQSIDNLSCTRIVWTDGVPRLEQVNHCP